MCRRSKAKRRNLDENFRSEIEVILAILQALQIEGTSV